MESRDGTHFNDAGELDIGFDTIPLVQQVSLGGGYSEAPELTEALPGLCRTGVTFMFTRPDGPAFERAVVDRSADTA